MNAEEKLLGEREVHKHAVKELRLQVRDLYCALRFLYSAVKHLPADDQYGDQLRFASLVIGAYDGLLPALKPDAERIAKALIDLASRYENDTPIFSDAFLEKALSPDTREG